MKKPIAILIPSLCNGGAERAAANLSKELSKTYQVHLMLFTDENISYPYEGTIFCVGNAYKKTFLAKAFNYIKRYSRIKKYKKQHNIQTVISFMPPSNFYNVLTKGKGRAIISVRAKMSAARDSIWRKLLIPWCGKMADMTVAVSEDTRQDLIRHFGYSPQKVITIRNLCNPANLEHTNPGVEKLISQFDFSGFTIVTVGRFSLQKAQWHLLRAFSVLHKKYPAAKLVFFGQGELEQSLKEYAGKLGIKENTFFMGYVKNQHAFLRKCDLFVLPSFFEGLSNALLEAMACGLPVISTECQSEVLSDQLHDVSTLEQAAYGMLIPPFARNPFDVNDLEKEPNDLLLAQAMEKLLTDKTVNTHYRIQSAKRIQDFLPQAIINQWIKVIENR